ncbi:hypothetical protein DFH27DRAFT_525034 [Peziza echinospora]|nr:hypothetical protein DFH27DRAFT_525034 [Peziza echinospora]
MNQNMTNISLSGIDESDMAQVEALVAKLKQKSASHPHQPVPQKRPRDNAKSNNQMPSSGQQQLNQLQQSRRPPPVMNLESGSARGQATSIPGRQLSKSTVNVKIEGHQLIEKPDGDPSAAKIKQLFNSSSAKWIELKDQSRDCITTHNMKEKDANGEPQLFRALTDAKLNKAKNDLLHDNRFNSFFRLAKNNWLAHWVIKHAVNDWIKAYKRKINQDDSNQEGPTATPPNQNEFDDYGDITQAPYHINEEDEEHFEGIDYSTWEVRNVNGQRTYCMRVEDDTVEDFEPQGFNTMEDNEMVDNDEDAKLFTDMDNNYHKDNIQPDEIFSSPSLPVNSAFPAKQYNIRDPSTGRFQLSSSPPGEDVLDNSRTKAVTKGYTKKRPIQLDDSGEESDPIADVTMDELREALRLYKRHKFSKATTPTPTTSYRRHAPAPDVEFSMPIARQSEDTHKDDRTMRQNQQVRPPATPKSKRVNSNAVPIVANTIANRNNTGNTIANQRFRPSEVESLPAALESHSGRNRVGDTPSRIHDQADARGGAQITSMLRVFKANAADFFDWTPKQVSYDMWIYRACGLFFQSGTQSDLLMWASQCIFTYKTCTHGDEIARNDGQKLYVGLAAPPVNVSMPKAKVTNGQSNTIQNQRHGQQHNRYHGDRVPDSKTSSSRGINQSHGSNTGGSRTGGERSKQSSGLDVVFNPALSSPNPWSLFDDHTSSLIQQHVHASQLPCEPNPTTPIVIDLLSSEENSQNSNTHMPSTYSHPQSPIRIHKKPQSQANSELQGNTQSQSHVGSQLQNKSADRQGRENIQNSQHTASRSSTTESRNQSEGQALDKGKSRAVQEHPNDHTRPISSSANQAIHIAEFALSHIDKTTTRANQEVAFLPQHLEGILDIETLKLKYNIIKWKYIRMCAILEKNQGGTVHDSSYHSSDSKNWDSSVSYDELLGLYRPWKPDNLEQYQSENGEPPSYDTNNKELLDTDETDEDYIPHTQPSLPVHKYSKYGSYRPARAIAKPNYKEAEEIHILSTLDVDQESISSSVASKLTHHVPTGLQKPPVPSTTMSYTIAAIPEPSYRLGTAIPLPTKRGLTLAESMELLDSIADDTQDLPQPPPDSQSQPIPPREYNGSNTTSAGSNSNPASHPPASGLQSNTNPLQRGGPSTTTSSTAPYQMKFARPEPRDRGDCIVQHMQFSTRQPQLPNSYNVSKKKNPPPSNIIKKGRGRKKGILNKKTLERLRIQRELEQSYNNGIQPIANIVDVQFSQTSTSPSSQEQSQSLIGASQQSQPRIVRVRQQCPPSMDYLKQEALLKA